MIYVSKNNLSGNEPRCVQLVVPIFSHLKFGMELFQSGINDFCRLQELTNISEKTNCEKPQRDVALLYFSLTPNAELRQRKWTRTPERRKRQLLVRSLIAHSETLVQQTGLPVFHFHEGNQRGSSFGERITNAYLDLFARGYKSVIAVGNDVPDLCQTNWNKVSAKLSSGNPVLGFTQYGGAYFIGMQRADFNPEEFSNLPWQTPQIGKALEAHFIQNAGNKIHFVATLLETHFLRDCYQIIHQKGSDSSLYKWFISILFKYYYSDTYKIYHNALLRYRSSQLRAPR